MSFSKALLCAIMLLFIFSCTEDTSYELVNELPVSRIEYTETRDDVSITEIFTEGPEYRFDDKREYRRDSCGIFQSRIDMIGGMDDNRSIGLIFISLVSPEKMDDNSILFKEPLDFEKHLDQQPLNIINITDFCELKEAETAIQIISVSGSISSNSFDFSFIDTAEVVKYEFKKITFNDLGYIVLDAEFNYTTEDFAPDLGYFPFNVKLQHAIRFPELDK